MRHKARRRHEISGKTRFKTVVLSAFLCLMSYLDKAFPLKKCLRRELLHFLALACVSCILEKWKKRLRPLGTAILSLNLKIWFQVVGFAPSRTVGKFFFTAPPSMSSTRTDEYFSKNLSRCNVFF